MKPLTSLPLGGGCSLIFIRGVGGGAPLTPFRYYAIVLPKAVLGGGVGGRPQKFSSSLRPALA